VRATGGFSIVFGKIGGLFASGSFAFTSCSCSLCGKEAVRRVVAVGIVKMPGGCWGWQGECARRGRELLKNLLGVGLAQKVSSDADEDQEPPPRFFSSRLSGFEI